MVTTEHKRRTRGEKTRGEVCLNCEARIDTRYCPHCGQENVHGDHSVGVLARDFLTEIAYYDSKVWLTFRTMFTHPGLLSVEWAQGKRMKYVSPIKLYLWITFIFFFVMALRPATVTSQTTTTHTTAPLGRNMDNDFGRIESKHAWLDGPLERLKTAVTKEPQQFAQSMRDQFPKVLFVLLPLLAFILKLLYSRQRKYYVDNLVFVLHLHSCYFAVLLIAMLIPSAALRASPILATLAAIVGVLLLAWIVAYSFLALTRFYGQPWWMTALKSLVLGSVYSTLILVGVLTAAIIALYNLPTPPSPTPSAPASAAASGP